MEVLKLILICAALLALCIAGMSISIWIKKNGKFPETEVGHNKNMRKLGLVCAKQEEINLWKKSKKRGAKPDTSCESCCCSCGELGELKEKLDTEG